MHNQFGGVLKGHRGIFPIFDTLPLKSNYLDLHQPGASYKGSISHYF